MKHVRVAITHDLVPLQSHVNFFDQITSQVVVHDTIVVRAAFQVHFKSEFRGTRHDRVIRAQLKELDKEFLVRGDGAWVVRDGDFSAFAFDGFGRFQTSIGVELFTVVIHVFTI